MLCSDGWNLLSANDLMLLDGRKLLFANELMLCRDGRIFANDPSGLFSRVGPAEMT